MHWMIVPFVLTWLSVSLALPMSAPAQPFTQSVLILVQSSPVSPWSHRFSAEYVFALNSAMSPAPTAYVEFLDVGRFGAREYDSFFKDFLQSKYRNKQIGVVVPIGSGALGLLMRNRPEFLSKVPIVFTEFDQEAGAKSSRLENATGTIIPLSFRSFVLAARSVVPGLKRIIHVGDRFERQIYRRHFPKEIKELSNDLEIVDLGGLPLQDVKTLVAGLPDDAAIAYTAMYLDDAGVHHDIHAAMRTLAEAANRPIVFDNPTFFGLGGIGGYIPQPEDIARESARLVVRILRGETAASIPVETRDLLRPIFDARQLKRWNVSESMLPPGSEILFREPSAWAMYRWQIVAIAAAFVLLGALIVWLLVERRRRRQAEMEAHRRLGQASQMNRALTVGTMSASIAHELGQPLGAILCNAEAAEMMLSSGAADLGEIKQILADIRRDDSRASEIINRLRKLMKGGDIKREAIDLNELITQTIEMLKPEAARRDIELFFLSAPGVSGCQGDAVHLQQVILNLAINGMDAMCDCTRRRRLLFQADLFTEAQLMVSIMDTGPGIPEDMLENIFEPLVTTKSNGTGLGLSIARSIIEMHGGKIWVKNRDDGGAAFHFTLARV